MLTVCSHGRDVAPSLAGVYDCSFKPGCRTGFQRSSAIFKATVVAKIYHQKNETVRRDNRDMEDTKSLNGYGKSRRMFLGLAAAGMGTAAFGAGLPERLNAELSHSNYLNGAKAQQIGFVIHGGAGTILRSKMTPELEQEYRTALTQALNAGYSILQKGGPGLDAIEAAIRLMEDSPLFNAGKGAVFTSAGTNELDASIMDGSNLKAGAVATLQHIKNPISLARLVMERSPHVMLAGEGAEVFAKQQGVEFVPQSYFYTERRWNEYLQQKAKETEENGKPKNAHGAQTEFETIGDRHGTVGAAALDRNGNLAAGTSTGGMSNKKFGRIGDSPIIGAGTYANNLTCAISATGDGEYFIRSVVGHDISALMQYAGKSIKEAAQMVIDKVGKLGGTGGVIGIDHNGNIAQVFNTPGMYRARMSQDGKPIVEIFND
jgi:beta-aspartyl-peptidase (threonine type)